MIIPAGSQVPPPPPPPVAATLFGPALAGAERYAAQLTGPGVARGLLGPREPERIWERHLLNCGAVAPFVPECGMLVDLGSGAGLPGVVLALLRPELEVVLLEPLLRRATFLQECVDELGLPRTRVLRARAEDVAGELQADVVTARAVTALPRLAEWALPLLAPGGHLLALKGESAAEELAAAKAVLGRLGAVSAQVRLCGDGLLEPPTRVIDVTAAGVARPSAKGAGRGPTASARSPRSRRRGSEGRLARRR